ncbi:MAG TPA: HAD-IB family phosphatase [Terriglobales bacterium]|jgi:HAD superfamily phosphoserine phosphatase-like hydrolase|nr:HAD-IB family phosphatase [Terriglobales bacterium]
MQKHVDEVVLEMTAEKTSPKKRYIFASDFDQTLSFNDSGYVLSELLGISVSEFERKTDGMTKLNLVQQGGELAYLLLHDPEFRSRVRREHLYETGKRVRLKPNIDALYSFLSQEVEGFHFDFYVISAAPVEVICSALEGIVPPDHIYGTEFEYNAAGEIERIKQVTAGYGKVAVIDQLLEKLRTGPDRIVYVGDGSSDIHVMLHINRRDGFTIAVSENKYLAPIAKRSVISDSALAILVPILEEVVKWDSTKIRDLFEAKGLLIQQWDKVQTDMLTIVPAVVPQEERADAAAAD